MTNFEVFHHTVSNAWDYFSNKMILEGEVKDAKMSSFFFIWFPNTHLTLISLVFSSRNINEFEKNTSNKSHQRALNKISFGDLFLQAYDENNEKVGATFSSFDQCLSLPFIATEDRKNLPLFLEFNWCEGTF